MTVQLKPHFLPRSIINSRSPSCLLELEETTSRPEKMARSGTFRICLIWLSVDTPALGIRIGLNKGYETTAIPKRVKPSQLKGKLSKKTQFVRSVVREVVGFAPYERRVLELLRNSKVSTLWLSTTRPI